jgi:hypothetical protein
MLRMLQHALHAPGLRCMREVCPANTKCITAGPSSVSIASAKFAVQTSCLPRVHDAKSFRGDVSENFRCTAPRHPSTLLCVSQDAVIMTLQ